MHRDSWRTYAVRKLLNLSRISEVLQQCSQSLPRLLHLASSVKATLVIKYTSLSAGVSQIKIFLNRFKIVFLLPIVLSIFVAKCVSVISPSLMTLLSRLG